MPPGFGTVDGAEIDPVGIRPDRLRRRLPTSGSDREPTLFALLEPAGKAYGDTVQKAMIIRSIQHRGLLRLIETTTAGNSGPTL